jgi:hypothetical protein
LNRRRRIDREIETGGLDRQEFERWIEDDGIVPAA